MKISRGWAKDFVGLDIVMDSGTFRCDEAIYRSLQKKITLKSSYDFFSDSI